MRATPCCKVANPQQRWGWKRIQRHRQPNYQRNRRTYLTANLDAGKQRTTCCTNLAANMDA
ncbi:MAG: hypothetical protein OHK0023_09860 [Anaerolineae bacterium]